MNVTVRFDLLSLPEMESLQIVLEQIGDACDLFGQPPGPALLRDQVRRRTAERLYVGRLVILANAHPNDLVGPSTLQQLAAHCWDAAGILADADPESPDRRRGEVTAAPFQPAVSGAPDSECRSPSNASPQISDFGLGDDTSF